MIPRDNQTGFNEYMSPRNAELKRLADDIIDKVMDDCAIKTVDYDQFLAIKGNISLENYDNTIIASGTQEIIINEYSSQYTILQGVSGSVERNASIALYLGSVPLYNQAIQAGSFDLTTFFKRMRFPPNSLIKFVITNTDTVNTNEVSFNISKNNIDVDTLRRYEKVIR